MEYIDKKLYFKIVDNNLTVVLPENYEHDKDEHNCFSFKTDYPLDENIIYNTKNGFYVDKNTVFFKEIEKTQDQSIKFTFYTVSLYQLEYILALNMETNKKNEGYIFVESDKSSMYLGGSGRILMQAEQSNGYNTLDMGFVGLPKVPGVYYLHNIKEYGDEDYYEISSEHKNILLDSDIINIPDKIKESLFEYLNELYSEREDEEISFDNFCNQYNVKSTMLPKDYSLNIDHNFMEIKI